MGNRKISFVMEPVSGGGPRNVFRLSSLLNESGFSSEILSFKAMGYSDHFLSKSGYHNYYGAKRMEPNHLLSLIYTLTTIGDNVNALFYPLFIFNQFILNPITLYAYPKPDIYIATSWQSFTPTLRASKRYAIPMMYFVQADETEFSDNLIYKREAAKTYLNGVLKFTQSKWLVDEFKNKFDAELNYIGFGIDHDSFYPRNIEPEKIIFTVARGERIKGFPVFISAVNRLWKIRQDFKVFIAGSKSAIDKESVQFPYKYLGWISNDELLAELYSRTIFVNTGLKEALPMPPLEAMACGGCVVMSSNGGSVEYTRDRENCLLTKPGDDKELTETLDFVLSSNSIRESIRLEAIRTAKKYNWNDVLKNLILLINREI